MIVGRTSALMLGLWTLIATATGAVVAQSASAQNAAEREARRPDDVVPSQRETRDLRDLERVGGERAPNGFFPRLDRAHDWLYVHVQDLVERTDARFVRDNAKMLPVPAAPFRIAFESDIVNRDGRIHPEADLDVDITLRLPNLEDRLRIFVTSDDVEESPQLSGGSEENKVRAGVRFNPLRYFDFDIGVRLQGLPVVFTSLRFSRVYEVAGLDVQPFAKVYLETHDGFGVAGAVTVDRWMERWLLRSSSYANWRKDLDATAWTQTLLIARADEIIRFGRYGSIVRGRDLARGFGLQLLASGDDTVRAETYEASIFFKQPTRARWLYWNIGPLVRFEREFNWKAEPGIRIGFDALFWDLSDR
jgi:hypothetical protein